MSTRREFTEGSLAALFAMFMAAWGSGTNASGHAHERVEFDPGRHETLAIAMVVSAGIQSEGAGLHPVLRFLLCDEPMDPQDVWMIDRCRQELYAVLDRLEAA